MADFYRRRGKRIVDVVGAGGLLTITLPVYLIAALSIRLRMGSPVFFRQERPGMNGLPITVMKLRTMEVPTTQQAGVASDASRLTPLGKHLRALSIDELPQLWSVLRGEMSLVGPRPLLMEYLPRYNAKQARRHEVRPGLTGWAQVNGRNALSWEEKFEYDVWYVDHMSFWLDMQILGRTLVSVLSGRGISSPGSATMQEFNP
jgi:sugar transferase EpsL